MLLGDEAFDSCCDALVAHIAILITQQPSVESECGGSLMDGETALCPETSLVLRSGYDRLVSRSSALVDEIANELATWPGIRIERRADGEVLVRYEHAELGVLSRDLGVAELPVLTPEHDELIEHGDAEAADLTPDSAGVSHDLHGPADVTAVLELFDRRYRDVRGADEPYSSQDSG
jgi:hypothetical protein